MIFTKTYEELVAIANEHGIDPDMYVDVFVREIGQDLTSRKPIPEGDIELKNRAYGPGQLRKPAVDDVNRIFGTKFTVEDVKNNEDINLQVTALYLKALTGPYWKTHGKTKKHNNVDDYAYAAFRHGPAVTKKAVRNELFIKPRGSKSKFGVTKAQDNNRQIYRNFVPELPIPQPIPKPDIPPPPSGGGGAPVPITESIEAPAQPVPEAMPTQVPESIPPTEDMSMMQEGVSTSAMAGQLSGGAASILQQLRNSTELRNGADNTVPLLNNDPQLPPQDLVSGGGGGRGRGGFAAGNSPTRSRDVSSSWSGNIPRGETSWKGRVRDRVPSKTTEDEDTLQQQYMFDLKGQYKIMNPTELDTDTHIAIKYAGPEVPREQVINNLLNKGVIVPENQFVAYPDNYQPSDPDAPGFEVPGFVRMYNRTNDQSDKAIVRALIDKGFIVREQSSLGRFVLSTVLGVTQSTTEFVHSAVDALNNLAGLAPESGIRDEIRLHLLKQKEWVRSRPEEIPLIEDFRKDQTTGESVGEGVAQWVAGWKTAGKLLKSTKTGGRFMKTEKLKGLALREALTEYAAFGPDAKNLLHLAADHGFLPELTEFFKTDPEDEDSVNRFKNSLSGVITASLIQSIVSSAKIMRRDRRDYMQTQIKVRDAQAAKRKARKDAIDKRTHQTQLSQEIADKARLKAKKLVDDGYSVGAAKLLAGWKTGEPRVVNPEIVRKVAEAAEESLRLDSNQKIFEQIIGGIVHGNLTVDGLETILTKHKLTPREFAEEWGATISLAGRELGLLSHLSRQLRHKFRGDDDAFKIFNELSGRPPPFESLHRAWQMLENVRRAAIVSQLSTAMRNAFSSAGRFSLLAADEAMQNALRALMKGRGHVPGGSNTGDRVGGAFSLQTWSDEFKGTLSLLAGFPQAAMSDLRATIRNQRDNSTRIFGVRWLPIPAIKFTDKDVKQADQILDEVLNLVGKSDDKAAAVQLTRLVSQPVQEAVGGDLVQVLNIFNRAQEIFFRRAFFEGKIRQTIKRKGLDINNMGPNDLTQKELEDAIEFSLEGTFAANPKSAGAKQFVNMWRNNPVLSAINPFPRFMFGNALPFMYEHSPLGLARLLEGANPLLADKAIADMWKHKPEEMAKILSRSMIGTGLMWSAWQLRQSKYAGEKWHELNMFDKEGNLTGEITDFRVWSPLTSFMLMADTGIKLTNSWLRPDHRLGTFTWDTAVNVVQEGMGISRPTMIKPLTYAFLGDPDTAKVQLKLFMAQLIGSYTIPFRTAGDIVDLDMRQLPGDFPFATEGDILRDTKNSWLGPLLSNIPGFKQQLKFFTTPYSSPQDYGHYDPIKNRRDRTRYEDDFDLYHGDDSRSALTQQGRARKQYTGVSTRPKSVFERAVDRLGIGKGLPYARTGHDEPDRLINLYFGQIMNQLIEPYLESPGFKRMDTPMQKNTLEIIIKKYKPKAVKAFALRHPDEAAVVELDKDLHSKLSQTQYDWLINAGFALDSWESKMKFVKGLKSSNQ